MRELVGGEWAKTLNLSDTQVGCNLPFSVPVPQFPPSSWPIIQTERERWECAGLSTSTKQLRPGKSKLPCKRMITVRTHCSTCPWNTLQAFVNASCQRRFEILCISHGSVADTGVRWESYDVHLALRRTQDGIVTWTWKPPRSRVLSNASQGSGRSRGLWRPSWTAWHLSLGRCQAKQCWSSVIVWLDAHAFINL